MKLLRGFSCFLLAVAALSAAAEPSPGDKINVMTLNQYLGADLTRVLAAQDPADFNRALVALLAQTAKTDIRSRAAAQAKSIKRRNPDVLALQESWSLSCVDFDSDSSTGCQDPLIADAFNDYLELTLAALNKKQARYKKVALIENLDLGKIQLPGYPKGIPFNINGVDAFLVAVDRDAILVKEGIDAQPVVFPESLCPKPSADGCHYQVVAETETPLGLLAVERGFLAVDAAVGGKNYRIFNTHLEVKGEDLGIPEFTFYQASQAYELIQTIALSAQPNRLTMLMGDMNSSPVQENPQPGIVTPYKQFIAANYLDLWELKSGNKPGYSCCQPEDLTNRRSKLSERIDMIFSIDEPIRIKNVKIIGNRASTKTKPGRNGLWFSDHAAVAAKLQF